MKSIVTILADCSARLIPRASLIFTTAAVAFPSADAISLSDKLR